MDGGSVDRKFLGKGKWDYTYTVKGTWPFPTDMLRYDDAQPITDADKANIEKLSTENAESVEDLRLPVEIQLTGPRWPTLERWRSFGWKVL